MYEGGRLAFHGRFWKVTFMHLGQRAYSGIAMSSFTDEEA